MLEFHILLFYLNIIKIWVKFYETDLILRMKEKWGHRRVLKNWVGPLLFQQICREDPARPSAPWGPSAVTQARVRSRKGRGKQACLLSGNNQAALCCPSTHRLPAEAATVGNKKWRTKKKKKKKQTLVQILIINRNCNSRVHIKYAY